MAHRAEQFKEQGNKHFKDGEYKEAEQAYSLAIQKYSQNPLIYTNRAFARLKLGDYEGVIDDCLHSIGLLPENMKAFYYLAQAQLAINHPNEALSSALTAYDLCLRSYNTSATAISALVLKCKKARWEVTERQRLRRQSALLAELEDAVEQSTKKELWDLDERISAGCVGRIEAAEDRTSILETGRRKLEDLRSTFASADPVNMAPREVPDYLVDGISFEIMHDPWVAKSGHSYEKINLIEHLKRSPTDPLTRDVLTVDDLRPNHALREACSDFLERNAGWAVDW